MAAQIDELPNRRARPRGPTVPRRPSGGLESAGRSGLLRCATACPTARGGQAGLRGRPLAASP